MSENTSSLALKTDAALTRLSSDERAIYERFSRSGRPELAATAAARLYGLYLQGVSCEDISKLNPALDLATILAARVRYNWDERKDQYVADLMTTTQDVVRQAAGEIVQLLALSISVANKRHGERFKRYLATGDESELGEFDIKTLKQMKDVVEMLVKITGADRKSELKLSGTVTHEDGPDRTAGLLATGKLDPATADKIREILEAKRNAQS